MALVVVEPSLSQMAMAYHHAVVGAAVKKFWPIVPATAALAAPLLTTYPHCSALRPALMPRPDHIAHDPVNVVGIAFGHGSLVAPFWHDCESTMGNVFADASPPELQPAYVENSAR